MDPEHTASLGCACTAWVHPAAPSPPGVFLTVVLTHPWVKLRGPPAGRRAPSGLTDFTCLSTTALTAVTRTSALKGHSCPHLPACSSCLVRPLSLWTR